MPSEPAFGYRGPVAVRSTAPHETCVTPATLDIDELDLGKAGEELLGTVLTHEIAHLAAHQQHGHLVGEDRLDGFVHAIWIGHLDRRIRGGAVDELRIPVPVPPVTAATQVGAQAIQIGGPCTGVGCTRRSCRRPHRVSQTPRPFGRP